MTSPADLPDMQRLGILEFADLIVSSAISANKLRFIFHDKSFLDIFHSYQIPERWAYHWERRHVDGTIYRHDNIPHLPWRGISSFPWHYHTGSENNVGESDFQDDPIANLRSFLTFVRQTLPPIPP